MKKKKKKKKEKKQRKQETESKLGGELGLKSGMMTKIEHKKN